LLGGSCIKQTDKYDEFIDLPHRVFECDRLVLIEDDRFQGPVAAPDALPSDSEIFKAAIRSDERQVYVRITSAEYRANPGGLEIDAPIEAITLDLWKVLKREWDAGNIRME
jgi:hypothetical protein